MIPRGQLLLYSGASKKAVNDAISDLRKLTRRLENESPEFICDVLLQAFPAIVQRHGDVLALAAAEWYNILRESELGEEVSTVTAASVSWNVLESDVKYSARFLFNDNYAKAFTELESIIQLRVQSSGRQTITNNISRDRRRPKFARVPTGSKTCAWCAMMASRGFVYLTAETAGLTMKFHRECDCQITPSWSGSPELEGYDPDALFDVYDKAREKTASETGILTGLTDRQIAQRMRKLNPGMFTDSPQNPKSKD